MSQADITRLVVGEPFTMGMGRPVGQSNRTADVSKTLQWRDGKWQGQKSMLTALAAKKRPKHLVLAASAGKRIRLNPLLTAALLVVVCAGVAIAMWSQSTEVILEGNTQPAPSQAPTFVQAPDGVRSVDQPFNGSTGSPQESLRVIEKSEVDAPTSGVPSLPILAPAGIGITAASAPSRSSQPPEVPPPMPMPIGTVPEPLAERSTPRAETRPVSKPAKEEPKPPAVILDELVEKPKPPPTAKAEAPAKALREDSKPAAVASNTAPTKNAPPAAAILSPARGLIAITPDGKSAVFTDPATRLPKQFRVGDKLASGDTIKSIDMTQGKVIAGTKEYSLD